MYVNHSGWSADIGSFSYDIYIDEKKRIMRSVMQTAALTGR